MSRELKRVLTQLTDNVIVELDFHVRESVKDDYWETLKDILARNKSLKYFTFSCIGINGVTAIAEALKMNSTLTSLDIEDNELEGEGALAISEALKLNSSLTSLDISMNNIENGGATVW